MISKCVLTLTENLRNPNSPEYAVLGSCSVLATQTVLKHLTMVVIRNNSCYIFKMNLLNSDIPPFTPGSKGVLFIYSWDSFKVTLSADICIGFHYS